MNGWVLLISIVMFLSLANFALNLAYDVGYQQGVVSASTDAAGQCRDELAKCSCPSK